ncbi:glycosyltransferase family 4 protein [Psychrobacillus sp. NPDC096623]|uniref:glycosyltransferase family 4 protein n=1 Tax=Psychrobacillus sp. NPDC096623 TaxID=3364492 RepID=UPI00381877E7
MTILHLISGGETGGSKNHLISLLSQFSSEEIILCVMEEGLLSTDAKKAGIRTIILNQKSRYDLSVVKKLSNLIKAEKISLIHTHGPRANLFAYLTRMICPFKWVTTIHSNPTLDFVKGGIKGKVFTMLNMNLIKKIDHFFAVSHRFGEMLEGFGIEKNKISIIYNGISFQEPEYQKLSPDEFGIDQNDFVVVMVARYHPIKNHNLAIDAITRLQEEGIPVQLVCVGDGPERQALAKKVAGKDYIHLTGFRNDIHAILELGDCLLLTSNSESFPLVLLEAARAKKPIVTTDVGGVGALLPTEDYGYIVPIGNLNMVVKALKELYASKLSGDIHLKGEKLYQHAKEKFSLNQLEKDTRNTYSKLL